MAGAQARGLEAGFADPPTSQSGPSGQWPVAHLAHGSPYRRPHHPRPRPHASMPHASRRLPFPRDPTPYPSLTTTQSSSLLFSLHLPSALALVFFTPIHIHPPQQWPVRACFPLDLPSTARPRHCHTCVTAVCPRVEVVYAFLRTPRTICTDTARSRSTQHSASPPVASPSSSPPSQPPSPHTQPLRKVSHACAPCAGHLRLVLTFVFVYTHATERVSDFCNRCIHRPTLSALTTTANRRKEDVALVSIALKAPQSVLLTASTLGLGPVAAVNARCPCHLL